MNREDIFNKLRDGGAAEFKTPAEIKALSQLCRTQPGESALTELLPTGVVFSMQQRLRRTFRVSEPSGSPLEETVTMVRTMANAKNRMRTIMEFSTLAAKLGVPDTDRILAVEVDYPSQSVTVVTEGEFGSPCVAVDTPPLYFMKRDVSWQNPGKRSTSPADIAPQ